jgi:hypothetical protein
LESNTPKAQSALQAIKKAFEDAEKEDPTVTEKFLIEIAQKLSTA